MRQRKMLALSTVNLKYLLEFISIFEALELVPEDELESFSQGGPDNFTTRRAKKVARFNRQRAAEAKLQEIKEKKERRHRSLRAAALSSPVEVGEDDVLDDDGEEEREAWITTISLSICKAFDLLDMVKKEEEMLFGVKERQSKTTNNE
ncbi:PP2A regulatory subunit TAP46-like isoform X2 [Zingiber officinale]|uniref:PP2A regulatory subunit TAP46-like isoform X2 n=1 Tax=Zingiber officinale TaxID=94328 RepID=UPI001C4C3D03|nr:PP2A regulatory subunit TAP46-like isoform X2 [Zingiber officinale]